MKIVKDRLDLAKEAPLARPLAPMFEMSTACNFACEFCPTAIPSERERVGFARKFMDPDLFKRAVDELAEFPNTGQPFKAYYNGMGESCIHPQFVELLKYAVDKGCFTAHIIRTNGSTLEPEFNQAILDAGITEVNISIEAVNEYGYERITKRAGMFKKVVAGVRDLHARRTAGKTRVYCKIIPLGTEDTDEAEFRRIFTPICDMIDVEYPMQWNNGMVYDTTRGAAKPTLTVNGDPVTPNVTCPYIFYTLMVNVDGIVHLCCFDWSTQVNVGDMRKESLMDIWYGDKIQDFWRMHLSGARWKNPACRDCQYIYGAPDYLDVSQRTDILLRLPK
jgi:radical SAM protein with 4Fe4S-binding SPASM domain